MLQTDGQMNRWHAISQPCST